MELEALFLNINPGHNEEIKQLCKTLRDYVEYTSRVREYAKELSIEEAVERTITECIKEGILAEFLKKNRAEAKKVSIYEYDEEKHLRMEREDAKADGIAEGKEIGRMQGICAIIRMCKNLQISKADTIDSLQKEYQLSKEEAEKYLKEYWK